MCLSIYFFFKCVMIIIILYYTISLIYFCNSHLGAYINCPEPSTGDSEINQRIQLACGKFAELSNLLQNFHINLRTRISFLNCFVRSRLTYACQNWCLVYNYESTKQSRHHIQNILETNGSQWV